MTSLKKQALHGAFWSGFERFGQQGIQFVVSIILARLLEPSEFGLVAMITIFTSVSAKVAMGGFGGALIQRPHADVRDYNTVFWYNIFIGSLLAVLLWFGAEWIAHFYNEPRLVSITKWCSFGVILNALSMTQSIGFVKDLQFKRRSVITFAAVIVSGAVSVTMAFRGYGVWALVVQGLVMQLVMVILFWSLSSWRVQLIFDWKAFKEMFAFGHNLMLSVALRAFFDNIYALVIGKIYTPVDLGFFSRGRRFQLLCSELPVQVVSRVNFPVLSKLQGDPDRMRNAYRRVFKSVVLITTPLLVGLAVVAPHFITVLIGEKWLPVVPYLRIFCAVGLFYIVFMLNLDVLKAVGAGRRMLRLEMIKHTVTVVMILCLYRFGIKALIFGEVVSMGLGATLSSRQAFLHLNSSAWHQFRWAGPSLVSATLMAGCILFLLPKGFGAGLLVMKILVGGLAYGAGMLLMRDEAVLNILLMAKKRFCQ